MEYKKKNKITEKSIPKNYFSSIIKGDEAYQENKVDEAIEYYLDASTYYESKSCFEKLISFFHKKNEIVEEAEVLERAIWLYPSHHEFFYKAAIVNKRLKNYDLAEDYAERYKFYYPNNINNIINLIDIFRLKGNSKKAKELLLEMDKIHASNKNILKLKEILIG